MDDFCKILLTKKDLAGEQLLAQLMEQESLRLSQDLSADEKKDVLLKNIQQQLLQMSSALLLKLGPNIKTILDQKSTFEQQDELVTISVPSLDRKEKATMYQRMFEAMVNDPSCTSFSCLNKHLLGNISEKDYFILAFYVFVHCKRVRSDDTLSLFISGVSSTGKSRIFESVILRTALNFVTSTEKDSGVGRFASRDRNILFLHDVSSRSLLGADCERLKAITRGECIAAKIFGSTSTVEPLFVLATSNERLLPHIIKDTKLTWPVKLASEVEQFKKPGSKPHIVALQNRFLELHVRKKPVQADYDLKHSDNFTKKDCTIGLYRNILDILHRYCIQDFSSNYLYTYALNSLCKYASLYQSYYNVSPELDLNVVAKKYNCTVVIE